jgi:hypothetical protein
MLLCINLAGGGSAGTGTQGSYPGAMKHDTAYNVLHVAVGGLSDLAAEPHLAGT